MFDARRQQPGLSEVVVFVSCWDSRVSIGTRSHCSIVPGCGCVEVTCATGMKDTSQTM